MQINKLSHKLITMVDESTRGRFLTMSLLEIFNYHKVNQPRKKEWTYEMIMNEGLQYMKWCESNPNIVTEATQFKGQQVDLNNIVVRCPLISELCLYMGMTRQNFYHIGKNYPETIEAFEAIRLYIFSMKMQLAGLKIYYEKAIMNDLSLNFGNKNRKANKKRALNFISHKSVKKNV